MTELKVFKELSGVGPASIEKLEESDYTTLASIAVASKSELVDTTGLPSSLATKIINFAREKANMNFVTGSELMEKKEHVEEIKIGSDSINDILGGGFQTGSIYEAFGEFGSGKTQIAHELVVCSQKLSEDAKVVYIDTESTFRPNRVESIAKEKGFDPSKVLDNTFVARSYNTDHQMLLADKVNDMITKDNENVKLVVVDSLTGHFRAEFIGRGALAERQQKLNKHMHTLLKLATNHNICVFVTNQVMSDPGQFFGDPTKAIGGHIVAHASTYRMYIRKAKKSSRVAKLVDSPDMPEGEARFFIVEGGLTDKA